MVMLWIGLVGGVAAVLFALGLAYMIKGYSEGNEKMRHIAELIRKGAKTYLNKQYRVLSVFVVIVALILLLVLGYREAIAFVAGALLSSSAGYMGMMVATSANSRTAEACRKELNKGLRVAFSSGSIMGMLVVGLGLLGVTVFYLIFHDPNVLFAFGFGASSIALFARVGGGIYTKAADVAADLVGKVEENIPEDDPRNPAVIADQVGDNVGDVAGMGADLFESYVDSIIAAILIGSSISAIFGTLPIILATVGIFSSILGYFFVNVGKGGDPSKALNRGILVAGGIMFIASYFVVQWLTGGLELWISIVLGLVVGILIGFTTEYYTSYKYPSTKSVANASVSGAATNIITGISVGMESTFVPVVLVVIGIVVSYAVSGLYGVALAAVGMLSILGITLAADTYGPVADNAAGIAEMAGLGKKVRERTEMLDAVGNTTAAVGKGFAIGSAALTALALFSSYVSISGLKGIDITDPNVVGGIFIGALLPFLFSALTLRSVGEAANTMVNEIRRQFKDKKILEGKKEPDYSRCIAISTHSALRKMVLPSVIALVAPIVVWFTLGPEGTGGLLVGSIASGFMLALFMANAGGAWDNAKKYVEAGHLGGKGSEVHKATVTGDTVGDPFKDCSGPSLNILIKLMSIISILLAMAIFH